MGCGPSKPQAKRGAQQQQGGVLTIGAPQDVMIHVPRNRVDEHGRPIQQITRDIDRDMLSAALKHVARYIAQRRQHVTTVAVGGAVNILYLRSRSVTHDIDVFGSDFTNQDRSLLDEAMQDARRRFPELGTDWLNTETQMWMTGPMHQELTAGARRQDVRIFDEAGLTIYAAPWEYAFSAKISRILTGGHQARPYDLADAVTYIHQYIRTHGNQPVRVATALGWARLYHHEMTENILRTRVNSEYRRHYSTNAFV
ncbi:hypothetical protein QBC33DRAFT_367200 [Phialemonium atrogriseum]|uniref:DUF7582 domain-containing protein n=1 Tax=Phialemonium atrogriseum TaxID=1093897 RepID=A0AAJ0C3Q4_9PEZI|nr:uncharacterized protein QBC33DRAFT_367200 [Phialemonium atrogriseum]KAK1768947.1 hypothetical protein QBC33DRAFT_367200 [Phialemonium atrogriseum]